MEGDEDPKYFGKALDLVREAFESRLLVIGIVLPDRHGVPVVGN